MRLTPFGIPPFHCNQYKRTKRANIMVISRDQSVCSPVAKNGKAEAPSETFWHPSTLA
jgi:hypothetical protein